MGSTVMRSTRGVTIDCKAAFCGSANGLERARKLTAKTLPATTEVNNCAEKSHCGLRALFVDYRRRYVDGSFASLCADNKAPVVFLFSKIYQRNEAVKSSRAVHVNI